MRRKGRSCPVQKKSSVRKDGSCRKEGAAWKEIQLKKGRNSKGRASHARQKKGKRNAYLAEKREGRTAGGGRIS